jgi:hypothetical protein
MISETSFPSSRAEGQCLIDNGFHLYIIGIVSLTLFNFPLPVLKNKQADPKPANSYQLIQH